MKSNFQALQCDANRRVKSDSMAQFLTYADLQCGLSPPQFKALLEYAETRATDNVSHQISTEESKHRVSRRNVQFERDLVLRRLLTGPRQGFAISNFQALVHHSLDGHALWSFFEEHERRQMSMFPLVENVPAESHENKEVESSGTKSRRSSIVVKGVIVPGKVLPGSSGLNNSMISGTDVTSSDVHVPTLFVHCHHHVVECFGPETYQVRDLLKSTLKFTWDDLPSRKLWWKKVADDSSRDLLLQQLRLLCRDEGLYVQTMFS
jgi:hypothetical protein